ncbi:LOW QUALITY PROTEIN: protein FAM124B-like [Physella acuta]|uniref:LOW QUALITY PROTEIN: protein FAM124B-like n=1 Tax=Physella acuta TaxID=109671 RepID=UPI0027DC1DE1|nr:LOW QUALITY PROTEIN: protein FAM124B-like [Physella acuta]
MRTELGINGHKSDPKSGSLAFNLDPCRITLHIIADPHEVCPLADLYQPIISYVDPHLHLFRVTERSAPRYKPNLTSTSTTPALAVMGFLTRIRTRTHGTRSRDVISEARQLLKRRPWRFHHDEKMHAGKINALPDNAQEYYYTSPDLPLWALRHVHYGRQHIRYVLYTYRASWADQVNFYKLVFGIEPDLLRDDFCLFTVYANENYDVQFALKKQTNDQDIVTLDSVYIQIKVKDVGRLVPLLPGVCRPVSDVKWQTSDHDGNVIVLDVVRAADDRFGADDRPASRTAQKNPGLTILQADDLLNAGQISEDSDFHSLTSPTETRNIPSFSKSSSSTTQLIRCSTPIFENGVFSSQNGDLDLPSPSRRMFTKPEDDEESLTLTNTSEESGIQMQQMSEDSSFGEEDSLRSCLNRNGRPRHVTLKVRFNEDVEAFSDDALSLNSSGIESDAETETRFASSVTSSACNIPSGISTSTTSEPAVVFGKTRSKHPSTLPPRDTANPPPYQHNHRIISNPNISSRTQSPSGLTNRVSNENRRGLESSDALARNAKPHLKNSSPLDIRHQCVSTEQVRNSPPPPAPPVRDSQTRLRSVPPPTSPHQKHNPGKNQTEKTVHFADSNPKLNISSSKANSNNDSNIDLTLTFTLKYDTCPTSGLGHEQIGFFV